MNNDSYFLKFIPQWEYEHCALCIGLLKRLLLQNYRMCPLKTL